MYTRRLTKSDVEAYWAMRLRSLKEHPEAFGSSYESACQATPEEVVARMAVEENSFIIGAFEEDGTLIGMGGFSQEKYPKLKHKGMIWGMYSASEHRGTGVGRAVMLGIIDEVKKLPEVEQINLCVVTSNPAAKGLYESIGFETYGMEKRALCVHGQYLDEAHMVYFLNR